MRDAYQVAKVRAAEARLMALVPDGALMQRAAAGLASVAATLLRQEPGRVYGARVVLLVGTGDNGGDALYAGERLARRGAAVTAIQAGPRLHPGGAAALRAAGGRFVEVMPPRAPDDTRPDVVGARYDAGRDARHAIGHADLIIDGLLGIGGKGGLREPFATLAQLAANSAGTTLAVDLPSGIDADTGEVDGPAVRADVTVTFGTLKPGLLVDPGSGHAGVVELVDIGLAPYLDAPPEASAPQAADIANILPRPTAESDKYRRGVLGLLAGSSKYTGAALLAAGGAVNGGAGMVRLVTAANAAAGVRFVHPEVIITELPVETTVRSKESDSAPADRKFQFPDDVGRVQAWVAGPGMGTDAAALDRLAKVLATNLPVLIDADGLGLLASHRDLLPRAAPTLLTPHAGELGRLLRADPADVAARRLEHARQAADQFGACVLLKGSTTVVAPPHRVDPVLINTTGTSWLATAGTGDVLAGLAGALLAQGLAAPQAAVAGAYLHGLAARIAAGEKGGGGEAPIGASDVVAALHAAFLAVAGGGNWA
jgi:ADP-dependent NAD(P)H-hydrate dehydratase / NAD(P)H-hydrate epimerase